MIRRFAMFALGVVLALLIQQSNAYAGDPDAGSGGKHHHPSATASAAPTATASPTATGSPETTATPSPTVTPTPPVASPTVTPAATLSATPLVPVGDSLPVTGPGVGSLIVTGIVLLLLGLGLVGLVKGRGRRSFTT